MLTSKKVLDLLSTGLLRPTFVVGCLAVLASCGGGGGSATPAPVGPGDAGTGAGSGNSAGGGGETGPDFSDVDDSFQAFIDAVQDINAAHKTVADFDHSLASLATTFRTTAILEAGRRSLDEGGRAIQIMYEDAADPIRPTNLK